MHKNFLKYWKHKKKWAAFLSLATLILSANLFFLPVSETLQKQNKPSVNSTIQCRTCHQEIYDNYLQTAHYRDSRPASAEAIKGSFHPDSNLYAYNLFMQVALLKEGNKFIQSARFNQQEVQKASFDIVIGSGRKGQSYLYWKGNQLFQLPISYFTATNSWTNSPGFPSYPYFERPVPLNCMECHSSFAKTIKSGDAINAYDKNSVVLAINCDRCHGNGNEHAQYQLTHPQDTVGKFIVNTATIQDRQIRMDACAVCHSGIRKHIKPPFSFQPGMNLSAHSTGQTISKKPDTLDVHGNQYGLLAGSKCYTASSAMDCSSCHNVHREEVNDPKLFSSRCLNCHAPEKNNFCSLQTDNKIVLTENCIDCHMPVLPSKKIQLQTSSNNKIQSDSIRTHFVAIYREQTKKFLQRTNIK